MRKITFLAILGVALGVAGCAKENKIQTTDEQTITVIAQQNDFSGDTRTVHDNGNVKWAETESVGLFVYPDIKNRELTGSTTDGGLTAKFSGTLGAMLDNGTYTAYLLYPYDNLISNSAMVSAKARINLPEIQKPTPTSFDPKAHLMSANPVQLTVASNTIDPIQTTFRHAVAFVRVVLKAGADLPEGVKSQVLQNFSMTTPKNIVGRLELNLATAAEHNFYSSQNAYKTVSVDFSKAPNQKINGSDEIYLCIVPITLEANAQVTFTAQTANYNISKTLNIPSETVFENGKIKTLNVTISAANVTERVFGAQLPWSDDFSFIGAVSSNNASVGSVQLTYPCGSDTEHKNFVNGTTAVYKGTNAAKFGTTSLVGSLTTRDLNLSQPFYVILNLQGWSANITNIRVTAGTQTKSLALEGNNYAGFNDYILSFNAEAAVCPITITTTDATDRRFFIGGITATSDPYLGVAQLTFAPTCKATTLSTAVTATGSWSASCTDNWISFTNGSGTGSGTLSFSVAANSGAQRVATITVSQTGSTPKTVTVTQEAYQATYTAVYKITKATAAWGVAYSDSDKTVSHTNEQSGGTPSSMNWLITKGTASSTNTTINIGMNNANQIDAPAEIKSAIGSPHKSAALISQANFSNISKVDISTAGANANCLNMQIALVYSTDNGATWTLAGTPISVSPGAAASTSYTFDTPITGRFAYCMIKTASGGNSVVQTASMTFYKVD